MNHEDARKARRGAIEAGKAAVQRYYTATSSEGRSLAVSQISHAFGRIEGVESLECGEAYRPIIESVKPMSYGERMATQPYALTREQEIEGARHMAHTAARDAMAAAMMAFDPDDGEDDVIDTAETLRPYLLRQPASAVQDDAGNINGVTRGA